MAYSPKTLNSNPPLVAYTQYKPSYYLLFEITVTHLVRKHGIETRKCASSTARLCPTLFILLAHSRSIEDHHPAPRLRQYTCPVRDPRIRGFS